MRLCRLPFPVRARGLQRIVGSEPQISERELRDATARCPYPAQVVAEFATVAALA